MFKKAVFHTFVIFTFILQYSKKMYLLTSFYIIASY